MLPIAPTMPANCPSGDSRRRPSGMIQWPSSALRVALPMPKAMRGSSRKALNPGSSEMSHMRPGSSQDCASALPPAS